MSGRRWNNHSRRERQRRRPPRQYVAKRYLLGELIRVFSDHLADLNASVFSVRIHESDIAGCQRREPWE
jgi:hypothetical protein